MSYVLVAQGCVGSRQARPGALLGRSKLPRINRNSTSGNNASFGQRLPPGPSFMDQRKSSIRASAAAPNSGSMDEASFFIRNLRALPWQRAAVWLVVIMTASQLSDFFGICMGTFVLTFIGRSLSMWVEEAQQLAKMVRKHDTRRKMMVIAYFVTIALIIGVFGVLTIPYIVREGADFISRLQAENIWVVVLEKMRMGLGDNMMENLERFLLLVSQENVMNTPDASLTATPGLDWTSDRLTKLGTAIYKLIQGYTDKAILVTSELLSWVTHFTLQVSISLILTFMLMWDWPNIKRGVSSLRESRLGGFYTEVAPSLIVFAQLFGKALQAQTRIAIVNTLLTFSGMWLLGIPGLLLLSLFVFMCSFIPVAGVIISTCPIGFVALTEYGFMKLALVILMVFCVHAVEAYGLNPAIYSAHLRLHPLLVLTVLVVAEHSLGVWGLLLAVPLTVFCLDYLIRYPQDTMHDVATKELEYVQGASMDELRGRASEAGGGGYTPSPGYTPDDGYMAPPGPTDDVISPEAQSIARSDFGEPPADKAP
eukprot:jgi/Ulvmu1/8570/UM045_0012.1